MSIEEANWLEEKLINYPDRASGEDLYRFFLRITKPLISSSDSTNRKGLIEDLRKWLKLKNEPRTMLAVEIATTYQLAELKKDIEALLEDIKKGKAFHPYYEKNVSKALERFLSTE